MKLRKFGLCSGVLAISLTIISCAAYSNTSFSAWNGASEYVGKGGTKRTVDGIDIWEVGDPARKYQVLGLLTQRNVQNGSVVSTLAAMNSESDLVAAAKKAGGDGILVLSADSQILGYRGTVSPSYYGNGNRVNLSTTTSDRCVVAVIKYLPQ